MWQKQAETVHKWTSQHYEKKIPDRCHLHPSGLYISLWTPMGNKMLASRGRILLFKVIGFTVQVSNCTEGWKELTLLTHHRMAHSTFLGRQTNHCFHSVVQILIPGLGIQALEKSV